LRRANVRPEPVQCFVHVILLFGFYLRSFSITAFSSCIFCVLPPISQPKTQSLKDGGARLAGSLYRY
jgi:hypothetical protein